MPTTPYRTDGFEEHEVLLSEPPDGAFIVLDASRAEDERTSAVVQQADSSGDDSPLEEEQQAGRLFHFSVEYADRLRVRVLVGRVPSEARPLRARRSIRGARLEVPTGALVVSPRDRFARPDLVAVAGPAVTLTVSAGVYDLECWELEVPLQTEDHEQRHSLRSKLGCLGSGLTLSGVVLAAVLALASPETWISAGMIVLGLVVYWAVYALAARWEARTKGPDPEPPPIDVLIVLEPTT